MFDRKNQIKNRPAVARARKVSEYCLMSVCVSADKVSLVLGTKNCPTVYERSIGGLAGVSSVLSSLTSELGLRGLPASLVLAPSCYQLMWVAAPPVAKHELEDAIRWTISDRVTCPVENSVIRCFDTNQTLSAKGENNVHVAVVANTLLANMGQAFLDAGLCLRDVQIAELCIARYLHSLSSAPVSAAVACGPDYGVAVVQSDDQFLFSRRFSLERSGDYLDQIKDSLLGADRYLKKQTGKVISEAWLLLDEELAIDGESCVAHDDLLPASMALRSMSVPLFVESFAALGARFSGNGISFNRAQRPVLSVV